MSQVSKIKTNLIWLLFERFSRIGLVYVLFILITRRLSPEQFGGLSYSLSLVALIMAFTGLGFYSVLVKEIIDYPDKTKHLLGTAFGLKLFVSILCGVIAVVSASVISNNNQDIINYTICFSLIYVANSLNTVEFWYRSQVFSKPIVISRIIGLALLVLILLLTSKTELPVIYFTIFMAGEFAFTSLITLIFFKISAAPFFKWRFSFSLAKHLLGKTWPLIISGFGAVIYLKIDQIMLGAMRGEKEVAIYAVAARWSEGWWFIPTIVTATLLPSLINQKKGNEIVYNQNLKILLDTLFVLALILAIGVSIVADKLIPYFHGIEYQESASILKIHVWTAIFVFMREVINSRLVLEDMLPVALIIHWTGAISNIALNYFWIPKYGGIGAAYATLAAYFLSSYFVLLLFPHTREYAIYMTKSLTAPFRIRSISKQLFLLLKTKELKQQ